MRDRSEVRAKLRIMAETIAEATNPNRVTSDPSWWLFEELLGGRSGDAFFDEVARDLVETANDHSSLAAAAGDAIENLDGWTFPKAALARVRETAPRSPRERLVRDAAEAIEVFGEDELERAARAAKRFGSVEAFYRVRGGERSIEVDFGVWWRYRAQPGGTTYRVSWVEDTGDVYSIRSTDGLVELVGEGYGTREEIEAALDGWADVCGTERSMLWVVARLRRPEENGEEGSDG